MGIRKRTLIQKIQEQALLENRDLKGDNSRGHYIGKEWAKISENRSFQPLFHKHVIDLSERPISLLKMANFDPNIRSTGGFYTIKYIPLNNKERIPNRPFRIGQDLVRGRVHVAGFIQWHIFSRTVPELKWLERNSTLTDELFRIAKCHPGMSFYFTVDWVKYDKMIREKAAAEGIEINNKSFVTYMTTEEELAKLNSTYLLAPERDMKKDYAEELATLDKVEMEEDI